MRTILGLVFALVILTCTPLHATGPEAAYGSYEYKGQGLAIQFVWDHNGIRDFVLNGRKIKVTHTGAEDNLDNFGSHGVWAFPIEIESKASVAKHLNLLLLVNNGRVSKVAGLYHESKVTNERLESERSNSAESLNSAFARLFDLVSLCGLRALGGFFELSRQDA